MQPLVCWRRFTLVSQFKHDCVVNDECVHESKKMNFVQYVYQILVLLLLEDAVVNRKEWVVACKEWVVVGVCYYSVSPNVGCLDLWWFV